MAVVVADPALAGVVQASGDGRAPVQGLHRRTRQGAVGHTGDVHHRGGPERSRPVAPGSEHLGRPQLAVGDIGADREGRVPEEDVAVGVEPVVGAEPEVRVLPFGGGVHPAALVAVEGPLLVVVADDVLAQLRAERLQQVAQMADYREVAQDGVALLRHVVDRRDDEHGAYRGQRPQPPTHNQHASRPQVSPGVPPAGVARVPPGVVAGVVAGGRMAGRERCLSERGGPG